MNSSPPQQHALQELVDKGLRFAVLRRPTSWSEAEDIDILADNTDEVDRTLKSLGYVRFSERSSGRHYQRYDFVTEQWVHLDVKLSLSLGSVQVPADSCDHILDSSYVSSEGIPLLHPADEAILLLFHAAIDKQRFDPKHERTILGIETSRILRRAQLYDFLPEPINEYWRWVDAVKNGTVSRQMAIARIKRSLDQPGSSHSTTAGRLCRRLTRIALARKRIVVFLGPDGAGKTSLSQAAARLRWPSTRRQYMGPARHSEMRWPFRGLMSGFDTLRGSYGKKSLMGVLARAGWHLVCYLDYWDRICRHAWFWAGDGLVVFDRFPCDMFFRKCSRWNELLFVKLFPRPSFVVLCVGEPEAIHRRKPELRPRHIADTIGLYRRKLAQYGVPRIEINTTGQSPDDALREVVEHLIDGDWFRFDGSNR